MHFEFFKFRLWELFSLHVFGASRLKLVKFLRTTHAEALHAPHVQISPVGALLAPRVCSALRALNTYAQHTCGSAARSPRPNFACGSASRSAFLALRAWNFPAHLTCGSASRSPYPNFACDGASRLWRSPPGFVPLSGPWSGNDCLIYDHFLSSKLLFI